MSFSTLVTMLIVAQAVVLLFFILVGVATIMEENRQEREKEQWRSGE